MRWKIEETDTFNGTQMFISEIVEIEGVGLFDTPVALIVKHEYGQLIASFPELLESLESLESLVKEWFEYQSNTGYNDYDVAQENAKAACAEQLEALIKKIKGKNT